MSITQSKIRARKRKRKKELCKKRMFWGLILFVVIIIAVILTGLINKKEGKEDLEVPTIDFEGKEPEELTWDEYNALTDEEKVILPDFFESLDAYKDWYENIVPEIDEITDVMPLDLKGKEPEEVTWDEYMSWSEEERATFPDYFKSYDDFVIWFNENN